MDVSFFRVDVHISSWRGAIIPVYTACATAQLIYCMTARGGTSTNSGKTWIGVLGLFPWN